VPASIAAFRFAGGDEAEEGGQGREEEEGSGRKEGRKEGEGPPPPQYFGQKFRPAGITCLQ